MSGTGRRQDPKPDFVLGVDLGQAQDYTALVVLERNKVATGEVKRQTIISSASYDMAGNPTAGGPYRRDTPILENHYAARHIERLPLGTPYPEQVGHIKGLFERLKATGQEVSLAVDQTGVGRAVVDMLRGTKLPVTAISIHGGATVTREGRDYGVPKRDLVSVVQVLLQTARLKIDKTLPEASVLTAELQAFKYSISASGHDRYGNDVSEWRENSHDDLVLAVAVAAWYGENQPPPRR
jgi:hypothetical protein